MKDIHLRTTVPVNADNFIRAETDLHFGMYSQRGALGKFHHCRDFSCGDSYRPNLDVLRSEALFDLNGGPVTISLPAAGRRFMSMMVMDEDHYVLEVTYGSGKRAYSREQVGTRYMLVVVSTLVNAADAEDVTDVHILQDSIRVCQLQAGRFEPPPWDPVSHATMRDALRMLGQSLPSLSLAFGDREHTDPIRHLVGTACAWGGNPERDIFCHHVTPPRNDGKTAYILTVRDVPVDGFWSITVYDADGHLWKNARGIHAPNSVVLHRGGDGPVTIQFGGCNGKNTTCLPIFPGWNYMARFYRPRSEIPSGRWKLPEAQPLN